MDLSRLQDSIEVINLPEKFVTKITYNYIQRTINR